MAGAARMDDTDRLRQLLHQRTGSAGVIQMDMREDEVTHIAGLETDEIPYHATRPRLGSQTARADSSSATQNLKRSSSGRAPGRNISGFESVREDTLSTRRWQSREFGRRFIFEAFIKE